MSNEYKEWINDLKNAQEGTPDHNRWLCIEYPFLIPRNRWTDEEVEDYDFTWTELDAMPEGWRKLFGEHMCAEIAAILKKADYLDKYRIIQIKEKYGSLRWYDAGVPVKISEELDALIRFYEILSERTCIVCGAPATRITTGWISPYCDNCISKDEDSVPIKEWFKWFKGDIK